MRVAVAPLRAGSRGTVPGWYPSGHARMALAAAYRLGLPFHMERNQSTVDVWAEPGVTGPRRAGLMFTRRLLNTVHRLRATSVVQPTTFWTRKGPRIQSKTNKRRQTTMKER